MQPMELLHKTLTKELPFIHKIRLNCLMDVCNTATQSHKLYLTGLGRNNLNKNKTGSNIQKVDRLLGNKHLHEERTSIYYTMSCWLIKNNLTPWIHIDWSCINAQTNLYILRASLSAKGRSIVLYEECYLKEKENNHATHKLFLKNLKALLPDSVKPIIVTDAGFRAPWFAEIIKLGWDFVCRLRNKNLISMDDELIWQLSSIFFEQATEKAKYLGKGLLTEKGKVPAHFILYKGKSKNRHDTNINKKISKSGNSIRHSKSNKEPWFLVTTLSNVINEPNFAVNIYKQRMRIEENFRDSKCPYYGLGLAKSLTYTVERMGILLLIGAIATFVSWLAGIITKDSGRASDFQAQSAKINSVLSIVFLGREALKKGLDVIEELFINAIRRLNQLALNVKNEPFYE